MKLVKPTKPLEHCKLKRIRLHKVYEIQVVRNEWIDWNGNTSRVRRGPALRSTLAAAQATAESRRIPGSRFIINSLPVLVLDGDFVRIIVGERHTSRPFAGIMQQPCFSSFASRKWSDIISDLSTFIQNRSYGFVSEVQHEGTRADLDNVDDCFNFESVAPGRRNLSLGWRIAGRVDLVAIREFMDAIKMKSRRPKFD